MSKKTHEPEIDIGFYASTPRIVRTHYRTLTPTQKWLYTCLKDLCGEEGTCYRTLRVLADETGISIGLLSESIPVLHKEGLIHAEKKKRTTGGKEVWHITIVDIWQLNGTTHPRKRSLSEQTPPENVHSVNKNVHVANNKSRECSPGEQECSQIRYRRNTNGSNIIIEELSGEGERANHTPTVPPLTHKNMGVEKEKGTTRKPREVIAIPLSEPAMVGPWNDETVVQYAQWCMETTYTPAEYKVQLVAARSLHEQRPGLTLEQFKQGYDKCNDDWWRANVGLLHVSHMAQPEKRSGIIRLFAALNYLAVQAKYPRTAKNPGEEKSYAPGSEEAQRNASCLLSEEKQQRNRQRLRERRAAEQAKTIQTTAQVAVLAAQR